MNSQSQTKPQQSLSEYLITGMAYSICARLVHICLLYKGVVNYDFTSFAWA